MSEAIPAAGSTPRVGTPPAEGCPVCGRANDCRLETGDSYKGPCWCEELDLPPAARQRLRAELPESRCLCRRCFGLLATDPEVFWPQLAARPGLPSVNSPGNGDFYLEGQTVVFTEQYHRRRGYCCASGCRHCPFREFTR